MSKTKGASHYLLKVLKILGWILLGIVVLFIIIVLVVRSPWGQDFIVGKVTDNLEKKLDTKFSIESLYLTFDGNLEIDGFYLEDQTGDTLLYSGSLEVGTELMPLIKGQKINIKEVNWQDVTAKVKRDSSGSFNFDFLMEALAPPTTTQSDSTQAAPPTIEIGSLDLENINLYYDDLHLGIQAALNLGQLAVEMDVFDLEKMHFGAEEIALANTRGTYSQVLPIPPGDSTANDSIPLPRLWVDDLTISNVDIAYDYRPLDIYTKTYIGQLTADLPNADIQEQRVELEKLVLKESNIYLYAKASTPPNQASSLDSTSAYIPFQWPGWSVDASSLSLEHNDITIRSDSVGAAPRTFDPTYLSFKDLVLLMEDVRLRDGSASLNIEKLSFQERSGFGIQESTLKARLGDQSLSVEDLHIATNQSEVSGTMEARFDSISQFLNHPDKAAFTMDMKVPKASLTEAYYFQPALRADTIFRELDDKPIKASVQADGSMDGGFRVRKLTASWGSQSHVWVRGAISNLHNPNNINISDLNYNVRSSNSDLAPFLPAQAKANISLPATFQMKGQASGSPSGGITFNTRLTSTDGDATVKGFLKQEPRISLKVDVDADSLHLGKIINNPQLGTFDFTLTASAQGDSLSDLSGDLALKFNTLQAGGHNFGGLELDGIIRDGSGEITSHYKEEHLNMDLTISASLQEKLPAIDLNLEVIGVNLQGLGFSSQDIRMAFNLDATFYGEADRFDATVQINDGVAVYDSRNYPFGQFDADIHVREDTTQMNVESDIVTADISSNVNPPKLFSALQKQMGEYLKARPVEYDTIQENTTVHAHVTIKRNPLLNDVLLLPLEQYNEIEVSLDFSDQKDSLGASISAPYIDFNGSVIDGLSLEVSGKNKNLDIKTGWSAITTGPIAIPRTQITGSLQDGEMEIDWKTHNADSLIMHMVSMLDVSGDTTLFKIKNNKLVLNGQKWQIPEGNLIKAANNFLDFQDFEFTRNAQRIRASTKQMGFGQSDAHISIQNFNLVTLTGFLNPEDTLASGSVNGRVTLKDIFGKGGLESYITVDSMRIMAGYFGKMTLEGSANTNKNYDIALRFEEGNADMAMTGEFQPTDSAANLDLKLQLVSIKTKLMEGLAPESFSNTAGHLTGEVTIDGTTTNPKYDGKVIFNDVSLKIAQLNTSFTVKNETLKVNNDAITFNTFKILDADNHPFNLDGKIGTKSYINPEFDLTVKAKNFRALYSNAEDNESFYGKVWLNLDLSIRGDMNIPVIRGSAGIISKSELTVVVPETKLDVIEQEGVVKFVNKKNPDAILTSAEEDGAVSLKGINMDARISIGKESQFKIVINERTGDNLQVSGEGDFDINIDPNGRISLAGIYDISGGHFEASLYNLVNRRFEISKESLITWNGDPLEPKLDISALYRVKASSAPLMATATSSVNEPVQARYNQQLPFIVYLNLDGTMLQPDITFSLSMPENERGALGGDVYTRVLQLNGQKEQLNKQVFSLLVLNRFYPAAGSDGSSGGAASIARDNVNNVLSGQLNNFSNKLVGDAFELDFGLNSYTDYRSETPEERTDLNINARKRLFNDRLIVQVGSEVNIEGSGQQTTSGSPIIGNVSLEYLLTENGRYRFKGFRKNEFENIIDGQLIVTGMAFIFTREFNRFRNMFSPRESKKVENDD